MAGMNLTEAQLAEIQAETIAEFNRMSESEKDEVVKWFAHQEFVMCGIEKTGEPISQEQWYDPKPMVQMRSQ